MMLSFAFMAHRVSPHQAHLNAALVRAAVWGDTRNLTIQLKQGADINARTLLDQTPLELAVEYRQLGAVHLLLDHRADVNLGSNFGTPLTWAVLDGNVAMTKMLLAHGAKPDKGQPFVTPLAAVLISTAGAKPEQENPLEMAVRISPDTPHNRKLSQQFKEKLEQQMARRYAGYHLGAGKMRHTQDLQIIQVLVSFGANVNKRGGGGSTPLMQAALAGSLDAARLLVANGALVDVRDDEGMTALFYASLSGATELVKFLVDKGADTNARGKEGGTAMLNAVQGENAEMVKILLNHGADPNLSPGHIETPLGMAKRLGNSELIALLKNAGARQ